MSYTVAGPPTRCLGTPQAANGCLGSSRAPIDLVASHSTNAPSDQPPFVSKRCPGHGAATTVRVHVPAAVAVPLVKRAFSAPHVRRHTATSLASADDDAMCLQAHLGGGPLARRHVSRLHEAEPHEADESMALPQAPTSTAQTNHTGRLTAKEAAARFGYTALAHPLAEPGTAAAAGLTAQGDGPASGDVSLFYAAVERAARKQHTERVHAPAARDMQAEAAAAVLRSAAEEAAAAATRRRQRHRHDERLSAETEGLLSSLTAFRFGLQRLEARRRWYSAAVGDASALAAPPVAADGVATEPFPCAVR